MRLLLFLTSAFWIGIGAARGMTGDADLFAYIYVGLGTLLALGLLADQLTRRS